MECTFRNSRFALSPNFHQTSIRFDFQWPATLHLQLDLEYHLCCIFVGFVCVLFHFLAIFVKTFFCNLSSACAEKAHNFLVVYLFVFHRAISFFLRSELPLGNQNRCLGILCHVIKTSNCPITG